MIFFSEYPIGKSDGMLERVKFIDNLFIDRKRIYISMSLRSTEWIEHEDDNLKIIKANPFLHYMRIRKIISSSPIIYAHSLVNAYKALLFYSLGFKLVYDVHGAVPEEAEYLRGSSILRMGYNILEALVLRRSSLNIVVTDAMRLHLSSKHSSGALSSYLLLPIVGNVSTILNGLRIAGKVVYAGGIQKWQNVNLMLDFIKTRTDFSYVILTPFPEAFEGIKNMPNVEISYAEQSEIYKCYQTVEFGFIFRDGHVLNQVACPTKLIEYLTSGVIPIVLDPNIGDFKTYGYRYYECEQAMQGLSMKYRKEDAFANYAVVEKIKMLQQVGVDRLSDYVKDQFKC